MCIRDRRWPDEHSFDPEVDRVTMGRIMERLEGVRPDADWRVVANLQKGIALMLLDRSLMHAEALDAAVDAVIEAICDCLLYTSRAPARPTPCSTRGWPWARSCAGCRSGSRCV